MNKHMLTIFTVLVFTVCTSVGSYAQIVDETEKNSSVPDSSPTPSIINTIKAPSNTSCEIYNNDCQSCVSHSECYFCDENNQCHFHIRNIIAEDQCSMSNAHFLTCKVNFRTLIIIIASLSGVALLIITIFCCYCCCKRKGIKLSKDDLKWARQREERKQIAAERRKERAERTDEIRKKYGLVKDSNPYQRFDA